MQRVYQALNLPVEAAQKWAAFFRFAYSIFDREKAFDDGATR